MNSLLDSMGVLLEVAGDGAGIFLRQKLSSSSSLLQPGSSSGSRRQHSIKKEPLEPGPSLISPARIKREQVTGQQQQQLFPLVQVSCDWSSPTQYSLLIGPDGLPAEVPAPGVQLLRALRARDPGAPRPVSAAGGDQRHQRPWRRRGAAGARQCGRQARRPAQAGAPGQRQAGGHRPSEAGGEHPG